MHPAPRYFQGVRNVAYIFLRIDFKLGDETEEAIACPAFLVRHTAEDLIDQSLNVGSLQVHESFLTPAWNRVYTTLSITPRSSAALALFIYSSSRLFLHTGRR
jgi:hypothetical protein